MDIRKILEKIKKTETPKVNKVAVAYSGGLDSSLAIELLRRKYKAKKILPITIDVGQGEEEIREGQRKAKILKIKPLFFDLRKEFTEVWIARAIQANSDYLGYPVSTSMTRQIVARKVAEVARAEGCDAILEGSSGKGNDQYRMHNVFKMFSPELKILVPVRDFDLTRLEEEALCRAWGVPVTEMITGGDDKTMWCRSIASGAVDLNQPLPDDIWMWYWPIERAPDEPSFVTLEFEKGIPTKLTERRRSLGEIIPAINTIGGRHSIGKI
ncbi:MAG: argininosuccinate synthase, partial [Desulfobacterales bacterium]|nr:argininosuccinate synthase [Desulfobacterales bacterium]